MADDFFDRIRAFQVVEIAEYYKFCIRVRFEMFVNDAT